MELVYPTSDKDEHVIGGFLHEDQTFSSSTPTTGSTTGVAAVVSMVTGYQYCAVFRIGLNTVGIGVLCILGLAGNSLSIAVLRIDRQNRYGIYINRYIYIHLL